MFLCSVSDEIQAFAYQQILKDNKIQLKISQNEQPEALSAYFRNTPMKRIDLFVNRDHYALAVDLLKIDPDEGKFGQSSLAKRRIFGAVALVMAVFMIGVLVYQVFALALS